MATKWEYARLTWDENREIAYSHHKLYGAAAEDDLMVVLRSLGEQGWELAGVVNDADRGPLYYFKRPLPEEEE